MSTKPRCDFYRVAGPSDDGTYTYKCSVCHRKPVKAAEADHKRIHAYCLPPVTFWHKLKRFSKEVAHWFSAGAPMRDPAEVTRIFEEHCQVCEHLETKKGLDRCKLCGCAMKRTGIINKIALATSHCPAKKW